MGITHYEAARILAVHVATFDRMVHAWGAATRQMTPAVSP